MPFITLLLFRGMEESRSGRLLRTSKGIIIWSNLKSVLSVALVDKCTTVYSLVLFKSSCQPLVATLSTASVLHLSRFLPYPQNDDFTV